jgi:peptide/nickel transport system substrate-binding protein
MQRHKIVTLSVVLSVLLLGGFSPAWSADSDTLRVGEMWEIDGLDPAKEGTFVKEKALITETLVAADPSFALVPGLAESWKMTSDNQWELTLRKGVVFHNGAALTAALAAASINRALDVNPSLKAITRIKKVAAAGELTLHITTDGLFPPLPATLVYANLAIVHPDSKANDQEIITHPIGTGPYALKEWRRGEQKVLLTRNEAYWGEKARIKKIEFRSIPDPATRSLEVLKGGVDFIPDAPYGDLDLLRAKGLKVFIARTARIYQINFGSLMDTPFADRRVRRALSHAINREEIVRYVLFGMGKPAAGAYENSMIFANQSLQPPTYDADKAHALLAEAGWRDTDNDGVLDKEGRPLSLTLFTYPQRPGLKPMAMAISQQWNAVGAKTQVRVMDWSAIGKEMGPGDARLAAFASAMIPDPDYFLRKLYTKNGADNTWRYSNPEVESLLSTGLGETDPAKRLKSYQKAQAIVFDDQPLIHIAYYGVNVVTSPRVKGFVFNPVAHDYMLNTQMQLEN